MLKFINSIVFALTFAGVSIAQADSTGPKSDDPLAVARLKVAIEVAKAIHDKRQCDADAYPSEAGFSNFNRRRSSTTGHD